MAYDGIQYGNRVDHTSERKLYAKVVDNILTSATFASRVQAMGRPFVGKRMDFTIKMTDSGLGQWVSGMETLSTSASDTTIQLQYAHTAFEQPIVLQMLESFANVGTTGTINLDQFKVDEAAAEARSRIGTGVFGDGTGDQVNGLEMLVDDGTTSDNIGGQSRATYSGLSGTVTASGGTLTLKKLGTLHDSVNDAGGDDEATTLHLTTKTVWSLFEELLQPTVRSNYASIGYDRLAVKGDQMFKPGELKAHAGFSALTYRGVPVIKDEKSTSGVWYMLNEHYLGWYGRSQVPPKYAAFLEKVNLGEPSTMEGVAAMPSQYNGWFHQKEQMMPNQAGMIGRLWVIGQMCTSQPRRQGKLSGVTGV